MTDAFFVPYDTQTLRGMRTRAKKKYVAGDRARRENVPGHILSYFTGNAQVTNIGAADGWSDDLVFHPFSIDETDGE